MKCLSVILVIAGLVLLAHGLPASAPTEDVTKAAGVAKDAGSSAGSASGVSDTAKQEAGAAAKSDAAGGTGTESGGLSKAASGLSKKSSGMSSMIKKVVEPMENMADTFGNTLGNPFSFL